MKLEATLDCMLDVTTWGSQKIEAKTETAPGCDEAFFNLCVTMCFLKTADVAVNGEMDGSKG